MRTAAQRVGDMLESVSKLREYAGRGREAFDADPALVDAMVLRVYQFCDAGKEVARQLGPQAEDVPWAEIAKMRDLLGHHYWRINPGT